jgi:uncharacterized protein YbaP (TraB family)
MLRYLLALLALAPLPACAQQTAPAPAAKDADPALWVVKDADTTIYLFGTIHVLEPGLTWFDEAVKQAFDTSDTLVTEIIAPDAASMQALVARVGANPGGPTLTEQLPADKRPAYIAALGQLRMPAAALDRMKPWLAAVTLSVAPLRDMGFSDDNGPETILAKAAAQEGKKTEALETAEQQFGYFNSLSQPAQLTFLTATLDELPKLRATMRTMVDEWSRGDPDALAKEMNDSLKDSPEVAQKLLFQRNKNWAAWISERMKKPGTVFIAVGAGHLAGTGSVQEQLAAYKLKAVRIRY